MHGQHDSNNSDAVFQKLHTHIPTHPTHTDTQGSQVVPVR